MTVKKSYLRPQVRYVQKLQPVNLVCASHPGDYSGEDWDDDFGEGND